MNDLLSIYIHIPFCSTKCTYCAFNTYTNLESLIEPFIIALCTEINIVSVPEHHVHTIFFGGGTPSLLKPSQFRSILETIRNSFHVLPNAEISVEANPNDLNHDYLHALRSIGVNRLSIGMQSSNLNELELFTRRHDNDAVVKAVSAVRTAGFENYNLDLIYGFPHQTLESWQATLQQALALKPHHLSLYALGLEDGTPMKSWVDKGQLPVPDDDLTADMYELATEFLAVAGYEQYEISNWSKPGYFCQHNLQYWRNLPYLGLGPGAHGYAGRVRYATILSPHKYIKVMKDAARIYEFPFTPAVDQPVTVGYEDEVVETLIMGLRLTQEGINRSAFARRFHVDLVELHRPVIEKYVNFGLLYIDDEVVRLTQRGRLLSNQIFRELV